MQLSEKRIVELARSIAGTEAWSIGCVRFARLLEEEIARALEPMVRDGERYAWLRENWHDGKGCWCDSLYAPANLDKAIDAAMSAALEDGNAGN